LDHNNRITRREMLKVVKAIYKACSYAEQPLRPEVDTPDRVSIHKPVFLSSKFSL
jgi:hypothetical protein